MDRSSKSTRFLKRQNSVSLPSYFAHSDISLDELRSILGLAPKDRSATHLSILAYFTQHIKVFAELISKGSTEAHSQCCRFLSYEARDKGDVTST